jgi:lysophospholipase L1-like esterase
MPLRSEPRAPRFVLFAGIVLLVVQALVPSAIAHRRAGTPAPVSVSAPGWVDAWGAAPVSSAANGAVPTTVPAFANRTLRLVVRLHAGGTAVRVRLSNAYGDQPVTFGRITVGPHGGGATVRSTRLVLFAGRPAATVEPGTEVSSDPVALRVAAGQDLAVSVFLPTGAHRATWHPTALQTSYLSKPGDHTGDRGRSAYPTTIAHWYFLDAVAVATTTARGQIVALGDSITDGAGSRTDADNRWPDVLYTRLVARARGGPVESVVNAGISGNRMLTDEPTSGVSALHRLNRDVLDRPGLRHVILLEGVNDLQATSERATADEVIDGYRQIIDRVRESGAKIFGGTLTPMKGSVRDAPAIEREREKVNAWIRTSGAFDGVVDFDRATRDPADPLRLRPAYDSGDHLHPSDQGYRAMATAIDLDLFR